MSISFYFDPSCPFCWITSRWLLMVSNHRTIEIDWLPFSLALKNQSLDDSNNPHREVHDGAHRLLRVMEAAASQHGASLIELYTTAGIKFHIADQKFDDDLIKQVLDENNLPSELLNEADNPDRDAALEQSIKTATDVAGEDIGVPTIVFTNQAGERQGFFGPVLQELPEEAAALELWDGLSKLATNASFFELKRSRPGGGPDVFSTARC